MALSLEHLECLDRKEQELKRFKAVMEELLDLGYNVKEHFCKDGVYSENTIESQQKAQGYNFIFTNHLTAYLRSLKKEFEIQGWNLSEFFCFTTVAASKRADEPVDVEPRKLKFPKIVDLNQLWDIVWNLKE